MPPLLYLDTARLGQMSLAAQRAHQDFARLAGEEGASIRFENLLWGGFEACPPAFERRYPGLIAWKGVAEFKNSLRRLTNLPTASRVLLSARSAELMKLAAILLCRTCRNVLVTDLGWSPYHRILIDQCRRSHRRMSVVNLRDDVLRGQLDEDEVIERVRVAYLKHGCDGLFLTSVSNLGVRLPVKPIVRQIESSAQLRLVVVDGAQDFCHVNSDLRNECADLYLAGCHKWLGGYLPLGLAMYGKRRSCALVETVLRKCLEAWRLDDPLLRFVGGSDRIGAVRSEETANLAPLFSSLGAVSDAVFHGGPTGHFSERLRNAQHVAADADAAGWRARCPHWSLQSGILLLQARDARTRSIPPDVLRSAFHQHGIALTAYEDGQVRLSMPATQLDPDEFEIIKNALRQVA